MLGDQPVAVSAGDADVAAAIEAADLAQVAGAHEEAVAFLATAADLAGPDDERLIMVRARGCSLVDGRTRGARRPAR
jgi:hypothetical protein